MKNFKFNKKVVYLFYTAISILVFSGFIFSNKALFGSDTFTGYYLFKLFREFLLQNHTLPLWNPYLLGGIPFIDALASDTFFPTSLIRIILPVYKGLGYRFVLFLILGGIFMYTYLRRINIREIPAFISGLGFMFSGSIFTLIYPGHDAKFFIAMMLPLLFYAIEKFFEKIDINSIFILGGTMGFIILAGHPQVAYFSFISAGFYFVMKSYKYFKNKENRKVLVKIYSYGILATILGLLMGSIVLYPSTKYVSNFSPRAGGVQYEYAASWSLHPEEVLMMLVPQFSGYNDTYWGRNPFKINCEYSGIIGIILALIWSIFSFKKNNYTRFFSLTAILTLLFALGTHTPFHKFCYYFIPGINKMRAPSLSMFVFSFSIWVLSAFTLNYLFQEKKDKKFIKILHITFISITSLLIIFILLGDNIFSLWKLIFNYPDLQQKYSIMLSNISNFTSGTAIAIFIVLIGYFFIYQSSKQLLSSVVFAFLFAILVFFDLWRVDTDFVQYVDKTAYERKDDVIEFLQKDNSYYRVFSFTGRYRQNVFAANKIRDALGFHDFEIKWYREFTGGRERVNFFNFKNKLQSLDIAGVKYVIIPDPEIDKRFDIFLSLGKFKQVYKSKATGQVVLSNNDVQPLYRIVHQYKNFKDHNELLNSLKLNIIDPGKLVYLENYAGNFVNDTLEYNNERVDIIQDNMKELEFKCQLEKDGFLVVSENYLPYWNVFIDGKKENILRAYGTFMAVFLESGVHNVKFVYNSKPLRVGMIFSSIGMFLFLIWLGYWFYLKYKRK